MPGRTWYVVRRTLYAGSVNDERRSPCIIPSGMRVYCAIAIVLFSVRLFGATPSVGRITADEVRLSGDSPFPAACNGQQQGVNYRGAEVEPWVAADPTNSLHLIGAWQQDRWSNGGASGLLTGVSFDGGRTWATTSAHFSRCTGGTFERATDPWTTFSPDGTAYQIAYSFNNSNAIQAMLVARSSDGGLSWSEPLALIRDTASGVADDKESITADPYDARYVYAVWDRLAGSSARPSQLRGPTWFARTTDAGATWEAARIIYDPGSNAQTIGNQIVVLPDGTVLNVFTLIQNASAPNLRDEKIFVAIMRSTDKGATWSDAAMVSTNQTIGIADVKTGAPVRTGDILPSVAVDPKSGAIYVVWQDARFSGQARDGIAFSRSLDGGMTWSQPVQVNRVPDVQAFVPAIAVGGNGAIAVTYYDFRNDTADPSILLTNYWRVTSEDGGASWREVGLAGPFDLVGAPNAEGYFLGDYEGLVWSGDSFLSFFVAANSGNTQNRTDVFATAKGTDVALSGNRHVEVNTVPGRRRTRLVIAP